MIRKLSCLVSKKIKDRVAFGRDRAWKPAFGVEWPLGYFTVFDDRLGFDRDRAWGVRHGASQAKDRLDGFRLY